MRDKVKRFISILMTALMLVNLMPVGALADGITSGGYQQQVAESKGNYTVYVYAQLVGDWPAGVKKNNDGWFTLGYINDVPLPSPGEKKGRTWYYYGNNTAVGYVVEGTNAWDYIGGIIYTKNQNIRWQDADRNASSRDDYGFKACPGATDTDVGGDTPAWHLNLKVDVGKVPLVHTLRYRADGKSIAANKTNTGNSTQTYTYVAGTDFVPSTITKDGKIYKLSAQQDNVGKAIAFDEFNKIIDFYYEFDKMVSCKITYAPGFYGDFNAADHQYTADFGDLTPAYDLNDPKATPPGQPRLDVCRLGA